MSLPAIVRANIRACRVSSHSTQQKLAKRSGVSLSYISMIERGQRIPPLDTLELLAKGLDVSPLYLLQEHEQEPRARRRNRGR